MSAFLRGQAAQGQPQRVFDWDKAARIIRERGAMSASAGLIEDWGHTGGAILRDGKPIPKEDTYTYLSSNWATPVLEIDGEEIPCWRYERDTDEWNAETFWPESALKILTETEQPSLADA